ncbi:hypothetical protein Ddye_014791 [Dipteronia dyeriana]|uniref:F-box domain-containing protein n=1 Tax=Dipteronia dyeriana TaxID=168575 RepID=A0AAD9U3S3_9ROSI|nr:hypothetical protein Ddye_014791 [Dipteronia dyeriana]
MEETDRLSNLPHPIIHHILSLMDTRYVVHTSLLSKEWRYHWVHIHSLNFDFTTFINFTSFKNFVLNILQHRKPSTLIGLRFHLNGMRSAHLVRKISSYALSHGVEELETNAIIANTFPARLFECLKTLKLGSCTIQSFPDSPFGHFLSLTTLQLYKVLFSYYITSNVNDDDNNSLFLSFPNLENLSLIKCLVSDSKMSFNISHPRLVHLAISCLEFRGLWLVVSAPSLKILNLNGTHPLVFVMNKRQTLEKVHINLFLPPVSREIKHHKQSYISYLNRMARGLCYSKSLRVSLAFSKGKFLLYRQNSDHDAEMIFEELKETEEDWLSFALPMVRGFGLNQLTTILEEILFGGTFSETMNQV